MKIKKKRIELSKRQREIIELKMHGFADKEVAAELGISYGTVRDYIDAACGKFGAVNMLQLVVMLMRQKII